MGALPSRETQRRGLYSHRHGRSRRNEVMLVPLTKEFFPSADCPLFLHLFHSRHRRTAKYYYRAPRPADTDWETDYHCQTTAHAHKVDVKDAKDGQFETRFTDDVSGLYYRLVRETEYCMCETDEELRVRYEKEIQQQQTHQKQHQHRAHQVFDGESASAGSPYESYFGFGPGAYSAGYCDAVAYMRGREQHTHRNEFGTHVTSPCAYYIRPVPCAIVSRLEPNESSTEGMVEFLGTGVKVLGMYGLLPSTIPVVVHGEVVEQHMLKATMFVDKDIGDQILGNVVMLAIHMYVRQCLEARIRAPYFPMIPLILRSPISNIPVLQFVREMRARLRSLLVAGEPRRGGAGARRSGFNAVNCSSSTGSLPSAESFQETVEGTSRGDTDFLYLFEEDVPSGVCGRQLFFSSSEVQSLRSPQHSFSGSLDGNIPVILMSGVNVQVTPIVHSSLTSMSHVRIPPRYSSCAADPVGGIGMAYQREVSRDASLSALRRSRFRIWVEDGRLCVWASAAYARRGCLILVQQLTRAVESIRAPVTRPWTYRGLLRGGMPMPEPILANDVYIVGEDMPSVGLYQGDVVRCSTPAEIADRTSRLALCRTPATSSSTLLETSIPHLKMSLTSTSTLLESVTPPVERSSPPSYANSQPNNALLQDPVEAPPNAFWVCFSFDRDDLAEGPGEKRQSQRQGGGDTVSFRAIHVEEVLLSWIKTISLKTRDIAEDDKHWVRDPATGAPLRVDRYVIRRIEHCGVRYFIGVTPRFVGQQRRLEKMLVDIKNLEGGGAYDFDLKCDGYNVAPAQNDAALDSYDDNNQDDDARGCAAMARLLSGTSPML